MRFWALAKVKIKMNLMCISVCVCEHTSKTENLKSSNLIFLLGRPGRLDNKVMGDFTNWKWPLFPVFIDVL